MVQFHIQPDSEIPASTQLFSQICFAIASRQFPPGFRLPSTRQLAMQTGLHRNTISKVYERLEESGFVQAQVGSGIYVRALGQEPAHPEAGTHHLTPHELIEQMIDGFLQRNFSLLDVKELFLKILDERFQASAEVLVTVPKRDWGAGEIIVQELQQALGIPLRLALLEDLPQILSDLKAATLVTVRYFAKETDAAIQSMDAQRPTKPTFRIIPIDIYNYSQELSLIKQLDSGARLGLVSLSSGTLGIAEVMISSLRGDEIFVMSAPCHDQQKLKAVIRQSQLIISDQASCKTLRQTIAALSADLIRIPKVICCENYIDPDSIRLLRLELGLETGEDTSPDSPEPSTLQS
ncbi:GntR family transcriptional regulator [Lyngbya confervoides BDU141951]|uniref:GntR family transcriptional regulator n=2 Tax=Lyngbya TaxID=28073 RepID=A0ABD4SYE0_9CYAN|nr:GntR family transcriptional regulator [Lyngbya confervoides]MCM1981497.1 GntR family transcriptional regulator [Lyngbya confervoides BDU141951]